MNAVIIKPPVRVVKGEAERRRREMESVRSVKMNMFRVLAKELFPDADAEVIISSFKSKRIVYTSG